jgi:hypothetical protein
MDDWLDLAFGGLYQLFSEMVTARPDGTELKEALARSDLAAWSWSVRRNE